jgi:uncharacterized protein
LQDNEKVLDELENDVRNIKKKLNHTRNTCPSDKVCHVRRYLCEVLDSEKDIQSVDKRIELLLSGLRNASEYLDEVRRDFHSKQVKLLVVEIKNVLGKYEPVINK